MIERVKSNVMATVSIRDLYIWYPHSSSYDGLPCGLLIFFHFFLFLSIISFLMYKLLGCATKKVSKMIEEER